MLGLVLYVHTIEFNLAVQVLGPDGTISTTPGAWSSEYVSVIQQQTGANDGDKTMKVETGNALLTVKGMSYGDNIGTYYDINDGYMGMMLGFYNESSTRIDRLFVKNNTSYSLKGLDIYPKDYNNSSALVIGDYYGQGDSLSKKEGDLNILPEEEIVTYFEGNLATLRQCSYSLVLRVQVRTETKISFQMTLPYSTDLTNIQMTSNLVDKGVAKSFGSSYAVQNNETSAEFYVDGGIVFNMLHNGKGDNTRSGASQNVYNETHNLIVGRNFYVKVTGSSTENSLVFYEGDNQYGIISIKVPSMYKFVGWYVYANNGMDVLVPGTKSFAGTVTSYDIWTPRTTSTQNATQVGSNPVSIDSDSTIYLVLERNPVTIKYDNGEWYVANAAGVKANAKYQGGSWYETDSNGDFKKDKNNNLIKVNAPDASYDINTMFKNDYMKNKNFGTTTLTYPGGLVTVVPSDIVASDVIIQAATNWTLPKQAVEFLNAATNPNAVIRNGLYIGYADSDALTRAQNIIDDIRNGGSFTTADTTLIKCNNSAFTKGKSVAIVGGTSKSNQATKFDVLLKDCNTWFFVGVPTGDATHCTTSCSCNVRKVNMYDAPIDDAPGLIGTFSFEADTIKLLQSIVTRAAQEKITSMVDVYIAKNLSSRLYDGLYWGTTSDIAAPSTSYSHMTFTYNCPADILKQVEDAGSNTTLRAILSGYKIVVNGSDSEFKHDANNSIYSEAGVYEGLNLANYGTCGCGYSIDIYPIWKALNVYSVKIDDSEDTLGFEYKRYALEGRTITYSWNLSQVSIATTVTSSTYSSSNLYTMYSAKHSNYVLSGLTRTNPAVAYSTAVTDTTEFKNFGVLRVVNSSGAYSVKQNSSGSVVRGGVFSFTVKPEENMTFYPIWLRRGYSVTYQYNGTMTTNISGYTIDTAKETTGKAKYTVNYDTLLQGTPVRVAEGFSLDKITGTSFEKKSAQQGIGVKSDILLIDGCTISGYYSGTKGASKWNAGNLKAYSEIAGYDKDQAVIGFALVHSKGHSTDANGSLISDKEISSRYGCDSDDHKLYTWLHWDCFFCNYAPDTNNTEEDLSYYTYKLQKYNEQQCRHEQKCSNCQDILNYIYWDHSHDGTYTITQQQSCTQAQKGQKNCEHCGSPYGSIEQIKGALGHDKVETYSFRSLSNPNCQDLILKITCTRCSYSDTPSVIPKQFDGHNDNNKPTSGLRCGENKYQCANKVGGIQCKHQLSVYKAHDYSVAKVNYQSLYGFDPWHCKAYYTYVTINCSACNAVYVAKTNGNGKIRISYNADMKMKQEDVFCGNKQTHEMGYKSVCSYCGSENFTECGGKFLGVFVAHYITAALGGGTNITTKEAGCKHCGRALRDDDGDDSFKDWFGAEWINTTEGNNGYKHDYDYHLYLKASGSVGNVSIISYFWAQVNSSGVYVTASNPPFSMGLQVALLVIADALIRYGAY